MASDSASEFATGRSVDTDSCLALETGPEAEGSGKVAGARDPSTTGQRRHPACARGRESKSMHYTRQ